MFSSLMRPSCAHAQGILSVAHAALDIPDYYYRGDPELVKLIKTRVTTYLGSDQLRKARVTPRE